MPIFLFRQTCTGTKKGCLIIVCAYRQKVRYTFAEVLCVDTPGFDWSGLYLSNKGTRNVTLPHQHFHLYTQVQVLPARTHARTHTKQAHRCKKVDMATVCCVLVAVLALAGVRCQQALHRTAVPKQTSVILCIHTHAHVYEDAHKHTWVKHNKMLCLD